MKQNRRIITALRQLYFHCSCQTPVSDSQTAFVYIAKASDLLVKYLATHHIFLCIISSGLQSVQSRQVVSDKSISRVKFKCS